MINRYDFIEEFKKTDSKEDQARAVLQLFDRTQNNHSYKFTTKEYFDVKMENIDVRFKTIDERFNHFDQKLDIFRSEVNRQFDTFKTIFLITNTLIFTALAYLIFKG